MSEVDRRGQYRVVPCEARWTRSIALLYVHCQLQPTSSGRLLYSHRLVALSFWRRATGRRPLHEQADEDGRRSSNFPPPGAARMRRAIFCSQSITSAEHAQRLLPLSLSPSRMHRRPMSPQPL